MTSSSAGTRPNTFPLPYGCPPAPLDGGPARWLAIARRGGDDFEFEYRLLMPDLSVKYLHVVEHATRNQNGELEYIGAVQDVTERRLSEDALAKIRSERDSRSHCCSRDR